MRYGPLVEVQYVDLADPEAQAEFGELLAVINDRALPYPLVALNGQLRLAGTVEYHRVAPIVDELLPQEATI
jgi:disulfide oxidoreductase YuzD